MTALLTSSLFSTSALAYIGYGPGIGMGGGNLVYWVIFLGTMALSGIVMLVLRSTYARYSKMPASSGLTGAQLAERILQTNGIMDVRVVAGPGHLTDHYDPTTRQLLLSEANFYGTSVAALGIAAHECGHALQHQHGYAPLQWRMAAVGITNFSSKALSWVMYLSFFGMMLHFALPWKLLLTGVTLAFGVLMLFQLITLPVEFNATARAKKIVAEMGVIGGPEETRAMNRVLDTAALTYVAAFIGALAQFLYYFWRMQNSRN